MKRLILLLLPLLAAFAPQAQKLTDGTLYFLRGEQELNIKFSYSQMCHFDQKSEKSFVMEMCDVEGNNWISRWEKEIRPLLENTFMKPLTDAINKGIGIRCGRLPRATYTMVVVMERINSTGHARGTIEFIESRSGESIAKMEFSTDGKGNKKDVIDGFQRSLQYAAAECGKFIVKNSKRPAIVYD